jgi:hypothetical protein
VGVCVDETGRDDAPVKVDVLLGLVEDLKLTPQSDSDDRVAMCDHGAVAQGFAMNRKHPVGRDQHRR